MGALYSRLVRQANRFNVENRAMRAIERKKPVSAPRHSSTEKYINEIIKETPDVERDLQTKNATLDAYLKDVYVKSTGMTPEIKRDTSLLPQNRLPVSDDEMGFWESSEIPAGYCSLRQVLQFLANHQQEPTKWTAQFIAKEYNMDENKVALILEHYKLFNLYLPPKEERKGMFSSTDMISSARSVISSSRDLLGKDTSRSNDNETDEKSDMDAMIVMKLASELRGKIYE